MIKKKKVTLSLDSEIYFNFQKFCEENAIMLSKKIEIFMKEILQKKQENFALQNYSVLHKKKKSKLFMQKKNNLALFLFFLGFLFILNSSINADSIFSDGFESGTLNGWTLTKVSGANDWTTSTTNPYQGTYHAQSQPQSTTEPASVMQKTVGTSGYINIILNYSRRLVGLDAADEFQAEWYDGTTWIILEQTGGSAADDAGYVSKQFSLPSGANNNPNFAIKFECTAGAVSEYCRVDNVNISGTFSDSTPPNINIIYPLNNTNSSNVNLDVNYTIGSDAQYCWWSNDSMTVNNSITCAQNITTITWSQGSHNVILWTNDSAGNENSSSITFFIDITNPNITSLTETPTDSFVYSPTQVYEFNATIVDNRNINTAVLQFNGTNYTASKTGNIYNVTLKDLPAGNFNYRWFANDSSGNVNNTETGSYTINKAILSASLTSSKGWSYVYDNTATTISYSESNSGDADVVYKIYRDNIDKGSGESVNLAVGTYIYTLNSTGGQNYSFSTNLDSETLTINKTISSSNMQISITPSSNANYGVQTSATGSETNTGDSDLIYTLFRNGSSVANPNTETLNAGTYIYEYNTTGGQNYTNGSVTGTLTVNKIPNAVNLLINGLSNNLTLQYPQQINASASSDSGVISLFRNNINVVSENSQNKTLGVGYYEYFANSSGNQNYLANSTGIKFYVNITEAPDLIPPNITLVHPESRTYGYNTSLNLNYSVYDVSGLSSCWYNYGGGNVSLNNCQNTTFNVSGSGSYIIFVYANDSFGNVGFKNVSFTVQLGSPSIILNSPINVYLNYQNIQFNYTPSDVDLDSCELWGNFTGTFKLNQTNTNPISDQVNTFILNLTDGTYLWNIKCNDSQGDYSFNGNKTFYVDTMSPSITINEPIGSKNTRTGIPLIFNVSDINLDSCWYSAYQGDAIHLTNTSTNCSETTSFNVAADGDFVLYFYVNDSAGNLNKTSSNFSVSTSSGGGSSGGGSSGGGGGGGGSSPIVKKGNVTALEVSKIGEILSRANDKKTLSLKAKNTGNIFLNNCRLIIKGKIKPWFYLNEIKGIAPGENAEFIFDLNVPDGTELGEYQGEIEINCNEINKSQDIKIIVQSTSERIMIKEIKPEKQSLNISYFFNHSDIIGKEVSVEIWVTDEQNENKKIEVLRHTDSFSINKEGLIERNLLIELPEELVGIYYVYLALSSELDRYVMQTVVIGKSAATGLVGFDTTRGKIIGYIIFVIIIIAGVLFIIRRNIKISQTKSKKL